MKIKSFVDYKDLYSLKYVDSTDWSISKYYSLQNEISYATMHWSLDFAIIFAPEYFNTEWNFAKATLAIEKKSKIFLPFLYTRFFAGKVLGNAPAQERIFLSGGLRHNLISDLFFGQKGYASPQEHIHIKQDGNMPGYQGYHIKTDGLFCVNLELTGGFLLRIFGDFGYYYNQDSLKWQDCYDAGVKLALGPISFILPLVNAEKFFPKNWSIEISGMGIGF